MRKERLVPAAVTAATFGSLYLLGQTWLKNIYLFEWTARHNYLFLWVAALALALLGKAILSYSITLGSLVGVLFGQLFGDFLVAQKVAKLSPGASDSAVYQAHYHHGVWIWLCVIFLFFAAGVLISLRQKQE